MRVLIVEDEYLIAADAAFTLEKAGCEIVGIVGTIVQTLKFLADRVCDAVILDANLCGESTESVALALRQRGIPFLVVSGYAKDQCRGALGDAPFLAKPCGSDQLVGAVMALRA